MLKRLGKTVVNPSVGIRNADFPSPFYSGLEYGSPARGTWNIVHVGMLIPEAHQIFVCAQSCLRGVVLTAAEMGASDRFSTIAIREQNLLDGDMEDLICDGVSDILERLPKRPPAILVYTSCIHHFMGCDLNYVYKRLRQKYPDTQFTDCYMNPIMRKSGLTPDQIMRKQLYSLLKPEKTLEIEDRNEEMDTMYNQKCIHIAGNDFPLDKQSELYDVLVKNSYKICQISECKTYEEYQKLANCAYAITTFPAAKVSGLYLEETHNQKHIYLPASFSYEVIEQNLNKLKDILHFDLDREYLEEKRLVAEQSLKMAKECIGDTEIVIDYTAYPFILSLAKLLLTHGFRVTKLYADSFLPEEKETFAWLQQHAPELEVYPTVHAAMRILPREQEQKVLAIGQKAAYFNDTNYFVNIVEGGGFWGYASILHLSEAMCEAYKNPKDAKSLIQIKGMGCGNCL